MFFFYFIFRRLQLLPEGKGEASKDFISLFVYLISCEMAYVKAKVKLAILNNDYDIFYSRNKFHVEFKHVHYRWRRVRTLFIFKINRSNFRLGDGSLMLVAVLVNVLH